MTEKELTLYCCMYTVHSPKLVGCGDNWHIPAACNGFTKSTSPGGIPRTTSQLKPSSGISSAKGKSGDSSSVTYTNNFLNKKAEKVVQEQYLPLCHHFVLTHQQQILPYELQCRSNFSEFSLETIKRPFEMNSIESICMPNFAFRSHWTWVPIKQTCEKLKY